MTLPGDKKFRLSWCYLCAKPQAYRLSEEILWLVMNVLCSLLENCHWRGNVARAFEAAACQLISASLAGRTPPIRRVSVTFPSMSLCLDTPWSNIPHWWCWDPLAALRPAVGSSLSFRCSVLPPSCLVWGGELSSHQSLPSFQAGEVLLHLPLPLLPPPLRSTQASALFVPTLAFLLTARIGLISWVSFPSRNLSLSSSPTNAW